MSHFTLFLTATLLVFSSTSVAASATEKEIQFEKYGQKVSIDSVADSQKKAELEFQTLKQKNILAATNNRKFYVILISGLSVISLVVVLVLMRGSSPTSQDIVLVMGLNFVIFGAMISVLTVETTEQLSAIFGLLGAVGGYLFGSSKNRERGDKISDQ